MNIIDKAYRNQPNIVLFHLVHKWVPPVSRRESVFWSHRFEISEFKDPDAYDAFVVCNYTTEYKDVPVRFSPLRFFSDKCKTSKTSN
jgi:hypothetical protein